jgi:spore photoproduct lyase
MILESPSSLPVPHLGGVNLPLEEINREAEIVVRSPKSEMASPKSAPLWIPQRAVFTPAALEHQHGRDILARCEKLDISIELPRANRVAGLKKEDVRATYSTAKRTLAVVVSPPSYQKLQPIPPSADWQYHLAEGCPAHCQYCYLAGSLSGPPVVRVFANLEEILGNLPKYEELKSPASKPRGNSPTSERGREDSTSFEVSCYTDPLGIEHLTGSLAASIRYFGTRERGFLRTVSKFDAVDSLLDLPHNGQTRFRFSINAVPVSSHLEGGTANVAARLEAARKMALPREKGGGDYPIGLVIAPIMPMDDWRQHYSLLLDEAARRARFPLQSHF